MAAILADGIAKSIVLNENYRIPNQIALKFVPKGPIDNKPAMVWIMAWRRKGDKPLSQPMLTRFTDASCGIRGDNLKSIFAVIFGFIHHCN